MAKPLVEIRGMQEIQDKMAAFPEKLNAVNQSGMQASLLVLQENAPPYPPPPQDSTYRRTGSLGRTLGSSMSGGKSGTPDIFVTKKLGNGIEGRFGTNLNYAPYVIGDDTQAAVHAGRWWTMKDIAEKSQEKILKIWDGIADKLAAWLDGKGVR